MMTRYLPALAVLTCACSVEPISGTLATEPPAPPGSSPVDVSVQSKGDGTLAPPLQAPEAPTRTRRRMDIDQLDAAIRQVTGGIAWTETRGRTEVNLFEELSGTLGKPDFVEVVDEDLEPSAMFQKFLDDAARAVCERLIEEDPERPEDDRAFFKHASPGASWASAPEEVRSNLRYLVLRYHGRKLDAGAGELEPWIWLVQSAEHVGASSAEVWRTVCVGLITHPDFYTY